MLDSLHRSSMVCTKRFKLLTGGTYRVNGTAEKATAKNKCSILINFYREKERGREKQRWLMMGILICFFFWVIFDTDGEDDEVIYTTINLGFASKEALISDSNRSIDTRRKHTQNVTVVYHLSTPNPTRHSVVRGHGWRPA
ncbi:unnamed protein product [Lactuca saligna]|uniref:Uncharacterized protein n=1 Tax=Lactuca saligna TaxID=75948 RepID=A0AA35YS44_LACSI|nr:unnamed protein product [Lactuca saligna]